MCRCAKSKTRAECTIVSDRIRHASAITKDNEYRIFKITRDYHVAVFGCPIIDRIRISFGVTFKGDILSNVRPFQLIWYREHGWNCKIYRDKKFTVSCIYTFELSRYVGNMTVRTKLFLFYILPTSAYGNKDNSGKDVTDIKNNPIRKI